ncbi:MAG: protein kinase domain-containing protein [Bacillota bacterium]
MPRSNNLQKEKLFSRQLPRSRVQLDIVNDIKNDIKNRTSELPAQIITYQKIVREKGDYYIYRNGPNNLTPFKLHFKKNIIHAGNLLDYFINILETLNSNFFQNEIVFPQGIKTENLYLSAEGELYLFAENYLDLQKKYSEIEEITPKGYYFIPPEIISRKKWAEKGFVFNTAALFYYFFTGRTIFSDKDEAVVLEKIQSEKIIEIKYFNSDIDHNLNSLFSDMLSKNSEERPCFTEAISRLKRIKADLSCDFEIDHNNTNSLERKIKLQRTKENIKLYFRRNWKLVLFFLLIGAGVFFGISGGPSAVVDKGTSPEQVLNLFYKGIAEKNIQLIEETSTADIGDLERMVVESHVVEKMQSAYNKSAEKSSINSVYNLKNLQIEEIMRKSDEVIYRVKYNFEFFRDDNYHSVEMNDKISVERENSSWEIVTIEGSLKDITAGNHRWEE